MIGEFNLWRYTYLKPLIFVNKFESMKVLKGHEKF